EYALTKYKCKEKKSTYFVLGFPLRGGSAIGGGDVSYMTGKDISTSLCYAQYDALNAYVAL
ncbi:MAG: hypothetical protein K2O31_01030, partial [Clostridia bacterium]|nr:hypothetical protein [Clostridia bacterium]